MLACAVWPAILGLGCDCGRRVAPDKPSAGPPAPSLDTEANLNRQMGVGERPIPRVPTLDDRFLLAVQELDGEAVERWLKKGAEATATDATGSTATVLAVREGADVDFLRFLLGRGAALDTPDGAGRTPLSWACARSEATVIRFLLGAGANATTVDTLGRTPLHQAVFGGRGEAVPELLGSGAQIDAQDSMGSTPLMYACGKNDRAMVRALNEHGADPSLEDKLGRTAADRAHGDDNPCAKP